MQPVHTHAVLQWDVSAQPDVIQGQLSRVSIADQSLKHDLWDIGTQMSVLSWEAENGCYSQGKGWEIAPGFPCRPVDHLGSCFLALPLPPPSQGKLLCRDRFNGEIFAWPGSTWLAIFSIKCLSYGIKTQ